MSSSRLSPGGNAPIGARRGPRLTGAAIRQQLGHPPASAAFRLPGMQVWCGAMARDREGLCHLLFSYWPAELGHRAWVTHSRIGHAVGDDPMGPMRFTGLALDGAGGEAWDADVTHNPALLEERGCYYLYYTGNRGNGTFWDHRNHQRIGVAVTDHPTGYWRRMPGPVLDVTPGAWDGLLVSNPSVTRMPDGRFCMIYKGVAASADGVQGGPLLLGAAFADHPLGPFRKHPEPVIKAGAVRHAVEDPVVWSEFGRLWCIVKDFNGYYANGSINALVLLESDDGVHWSPTAHPLVACPGVRWADGRDEALARMERPQLFFDGGRPATLLVACAVDPCDRDVFNLRIPLL